MVLGIFAFLRVSRTPIAEATTASTIHVKNQSSLDAIRRDTNTAAKAVTPISTPPHPGTAVNEPARSIVSRMYRRSRTARSLMDTTLSEGFTAVRVLQELCIVKRRRHRVKNQHALLADKHRARACP